MAGSLRAWKCAIYISSFVFAAIGIAVIAGAVALAEKEFAKALEIEDQLKNFGLAFGVIIIIIGLIGWLSAFCENKLLVCIVFSLHNC